MSSAEFNEMTQITNTDSYRTSISLQTNNETTTRGYNTNIHTNDVYNAYYHQTMTNNKMYYKGTHDAFYGNNNYKFIPNTERRYTKPSPFTKCTANC